MEMKQNETKQNTVTVLGTTINKGDNTDIMLMNIIQLLAEKEEIFLSNFLLQYKQDNEKEIDELHDELAEKDECIEHLEEENERQNDKMTDIEDYIDEIVNAADNLSFCFRN